MTTVADLGEFGLIERLRRRLGAGGGVTLGIGDDAAVVQTASRSLFAADMLVEGTHFDVAYSSPADVGFKAVMVNVSDIAAMGGRARYATVSLGMPAATQVDVIDGLYDGMIEACDEVGIAIVGGDCTTAPVITLSLAVIGDGPADGVATRSGARPGDLLCATGVFGGAAAGLGLLRAGVDRFPELLRAYRRPRARVTEGPAAFAAGATAIIDVSDGLARDAGHLAEESGCGLRVHAGRIPLAGGVPDAAEVLGVPPWRLGAGGGDDYELAMAIPPDRFNAVRDAVAPTRLSEVGEFVELSEGRMVLTTVDAIPVERIGWEHFA